VGIGRLATTDTSILGLSGLSWALSDKVSWKRRIAA